MWDLYGCLCRIWRAIVLDLYGTLSGTLYGICILPAPCSYPLSHERFQCTIPLDCPVIGHSVHQHTASFMKHEVLVRLHLQFNVMLDVLHIYDNAQFELDGGLTSA